LFKWFLACLLFGKPVQRQVAERAYRTILRAELLSPAAVIGAGWDKLVRLLDEAHYVRYDFSTATKLLDVCRELQERYGTVTELLALATTPAKLSAMLQEFKHIGPVTARIFLREVRPIWYPSGKSSRRKPLASSRDVEKKTVPQSLRRSAFK
jgi:endonuclease III